VRAAYLVVTSGGQEIVIDADSALGAVIEFYSGDPLETDPARIRLDTITGYLGLALQGPELSAIAPAYVFVAGDGVTSLLQLRGDFVQVAGTAGPGTGSFSTAVADWSLGAGAPGSGVGTIDVQQLVLGSPSIPSIVLDGEEVGAAWTPYVPVGSNAGGGYVLGGANQLAGSYWCFGKTVHVEIKFTRAAATNFGAGELRITLPFTATDALTVNGVARAEDTGAGRLMGFAIGRTTTAIGFSSTGAVSWSNAAPFAWGVGDTLTCNLTYQRA